MDYIYVIDNEDIYHLIDHTKYSTGIIFMEYNKWKLLSKDEKALHGDLDKIYPLIKINTSTEVMNIITEFINNGRLNMITPSPRTLFESATLTKGPIRDRMSINMDSKTILISSMLKDIMIILNATLNISVLWTQIELEEEWAVHNDDYSNVIIFSSYTTLFYLAKYYRAIMNDIDPSSIIDLELYSGERILAEMPPEYTSGVSLLINESGIIIGSNTIGVPPISPNIVVPIILGTKDDYYIDIPPSIISKSVVFASDDSFILFENGLIIFAKDKKLNNMLLSKSVPHFSRAISSIENGERIIRYTSSFFYCASMKILPVYPDRFWIIQYVILSYPILSNPTANQIVLVGKKDIDNLGSVHDVALNYIITNGSKMFEYDISYESPISMKIENNSANLVLRNNI